MVVVFGGSLSLLRTWILVGGYFGVGEGGGEGEMMGVCLGGRWWWWWWILLGIVLAGVFAAVGFAVVLRVGVVVGLRV